MNLRAKRRGWLALAGLATLPLAFVCSFDRHLATDGVNFLRQVIEADAFFFPSPTRLAAHVWLEAPLVVARRIGIMHLPTLVACFGVGMLLPCWMGLAASWRALPAGREHFIVMPVFSLLVFHYPLDGGMMHEGRVMDAMFWPALFFLLRREAWDSWDVTLLGVAMITLALSYEAAIGPGLLLVTLALRRARSVGSPRQRWWARGVALLAGLTALTSLLGILRPADAGNRAEFIGSLLEPWRWPLQWVGAAGLGSFFLAWTGGRQGAMRWICGLALIAAVLWAAGVGVPSRGWTYPVRTLSLTLVPALFLCTCWLWQKDKPMPTGGLAAAFALCFALGAALIMRLEAWREFRTQVRGVVTMRHGLVPLAETGFVRTRGRPEMNLPENRLVWDSWNLPLLSVVWSWPRVQAIILNPPGTPWEPFDPTCERPIDRFLRYDPALTVPVAAGLSESVPR